MDVGAWLRGLRLEQYEQAFRDNDVDADVLPELTADDLIGLGIASIGHRRKLLAAIAALRPGPAACRHSPAGRGRRRCPPATSSSEAERRQLTVMFVDLVGSTALSARLDPEEMGEVFRAYQNAVAGVIARFGGYVAKFMGDGVLAYFGWPRAHEDEAERAVRAGLAIVAAVGGLRTPAGEPLAARVGIATGLVMVGELIGEGAARERRWSAIHPTSPPAYRPSHDPGRRRGAGDPPAAGRPVRVPGPRGAADQGADPARGGVRRPRRAGDREPLRGARGLAVLPMAGRDQELALLLERWSLAKAGEGQGVLLVGEPGIGKSRITVALLDAVAAEPHLRIRLQCSPYHTDSALWPVVEHLSEPRASFPTSHRAISSTN